MKTILLAATLAVLAGCASGVRTKTTLADASAPLQSTTAQVCLLAGDLPSQFQFKEVGRIRASKGTYGGSDEIFRAMATEARRLGADAIVNLQSKQKFRGPLPWRVMSPTGDGEAVKLSPDSPPFDCTASGGKLG